MERDQVDPEQDKNHGGALREAYQACEWDDHTYGYIILGVICNHVKSQTVGNCGSHHRDSARYMLDGTGRTNGSRRNW